MAFGITARPTRVLGAAVLGLAFAACSHTTSSTSPTSSASTTITTNTGGATTSSNRASVTTASGRPTTSTSTSATTTPTGTPNCAFSELSVASTGNSGLGHIGVVLIFKNTSSQTCTLMGYPGVAGLNAAGHQVIQATRTLNGYMQVLPAGQSPPVVTLTPGGSASAFVEGTDVPVGPATSCPNYPELLVTPPNTTQSLTINASMPGCSPIQVHPVVPGTTGSLVA